MPAVKRTGFHLILHPRGGVLPETLLRLGSWATKKSNKLVRYMVVSEPNKNGDGFHIHMPYVLEKESENQSQKRRFETLFTTELQDGSGDWGDNAIKITSGETFDFYQLAAGYLAKDSGHKVIASNGIETDKLNTGEEKYRTNKELSKIKRTSRAQIPALVAKYYHRLSDSGIFEANMKGSIKEYMLDMIFRALIKDGYHHLVFEFQGRNKEALLHFWPEIISIKDINVIPDTQDENVDGGQTSGAEGGDSPKVCKEGSSESK